MTPPPRPDDERVSRGVVGGVHAESSDPGAFDQGPARPRPGYRMRPAVPLIALVLAFTAIPVELRPLDRAELTWRSSPSDMAANVLGFIPVGMVLARLGIGRALAIAALISSFAEACQLFMMYRFASPVDVASNVAGAAIGWSVARRLGIVVPALPLNRRTAWMSLLAALAILGLQGWAGWRDVARKSEWKRLPVNGRGAVAPGAWEAHWTFDGASRGAVRDSSGNGLDGTLVGGAGLARGVRGMALRLDGLAGHADFGSPVGLRLMGSLTITAWIRASSFPNDDAAVVSSHAPGYQLDTTVDQGPRTIGFKIVDPCGDVRARYGRTELRLGTWYHIAGVFDADARTLSVYLDGRPDDGFLMGPVPAIQHASGERVLVGGRPYPPGFFFAGLIDDVRVYSRALTPEEIGRVMDGGRTAASAPAGTARVTGRDVLARRLHGGPDPCRWRTRPEDAHLPGLLVSVGVLAAAACAGFRPGHAPSVVLAGLAVGAALVPAAALILPLHVAWMFPPLGLAGGLSVAVSLEPDDRQP